MVSRGPGSRGNSPRLSEGVTPAPCCFGALLTASRVPRSPVTSHLPGDPSQPAAALHATGVHPGLPEASKQRSLSENRLTLRKLGA